MDLGIAGKTALVCASTAGMGLQTARALAAEGVTVVFTGRRVELAEAAAKEYEGCVAIASDTSTLEGARTLYEQAVAAVGPIDILVLNGPGPAPGTATSVDTAQLTDAVTTLLLVQEQLVRLALPGMRERRWGRILAIESTSIITPIDVLALSNVGRSAIAAYLKSLATEVAADGVTVNLVLPGKIATDRTTSLDARTAEAKDITPQQAREANEAQVPARRYGTAQEFGAVAAFLCSQQAAYVTGTAVRVDGGLTPVL